MEEKNVGCCSCSSPRGLKFYRSSPSPSPSPSTTSSGSDSPRVSICVRMNVWDEEIGERTEDWAVISPGGPIGQVPYNGHSCASVISVGTKMYSFGGIEHETSRMESCVDTLVYDTAKPENGWQRLAPMATAKIRPAVVTLDGKIYVIGSSHGGPNVVVPWGEVYDISTNTWEAIIPRAPAPPESCYWHECRATCAVVPHKKQILIICEFGFYSKPAFLYNIGNPNPSRPLCHKYIPPFGGPNSYAFVIVHNIMYYFFVDNPHPLLYAYDLNRRRRQRRKRNLVEIQGLEDFPIPMLPDIASRPYLVHIANLHFCLVWSTANSKVHCLTFHINKLERRAFFDISNLETYDAQQSDFWLMDGLQLQPAFLCFVPAPGCCSPADPHCFSVASSAPFARQELIEEKYYHANLLLTSSPSDCGC